MQRYLIKFILVAMLAMINTAHAETKKTRITGIYSDMHFIQEAGDIDGMEVFIMYTKEGYYAVIQIAEGAPLVPVVVPVEIEKSSVSFTIPLPSGANRRFLGIVNETGLLGKFENAGEQFILKRRKSYWQ